MQSAIRYGNKLITNVLISFNTGDILSKIFKVLVSAWMLFADVHQYWYCIMFLISIDLTTGVLASLHSGNHFSIKDFRHGLIDKAVLYTLFIVSVWAVEIIIKSGVSYSKFYGVMIASVFMGTYELASIIENLQVLLPNVTFLGKLQRLLTKVSDSAEAKANKTIEKVSENI